MKNILAESTRKISQFSIKEVAHIAWAFANLRFQDSNLFNRSGWVSLGGCGLGGFSDHQGSFWVIVHDQVLQGNMYGLPPTSRPKLPCMTSAKIPCQDSGSHPPSKCFDAAG